MNLRKFAFAFLFPLGLSVVSPLCAQSDSVAADLRVFTEEGQRFTLFLNGKMTNEAPAAQVEIDGIPADYAHLRIQFSDGTPQLQRIITLTPGKRTLYMVILTATGEPDLYFFGEEAIVTSKPVLAVETDPKDTVPSQWIEPAPAKVEPTPSKTPEVAACLIAPSDFDNIYANVQATRMEMSKREVAWSAIRESCPMAEQVAQLVKLLAYGPDRLQLAQDAFGVVADRRNYYLVEQALGNPFDQEALREHMDSFPAR